MSEKVQQGSNAKKQAAGWKCLSSGVRIERSSAIQPRPVPNPKPKGSQRRSKREAKSRPRVYVGRNTGVVEVEVRRSGDGYGDSASGGRSGEAGGAAPRRAARSSCTNANADFPAQATLLLSIHHVCGQCGRNQQGSAAQAQSVGPVRGAARA